MEKQKLAILFSGGSDSLSLYALAAVGVHPQIPRPRRIHLLHMLNGMGRFPSFPMERFRVSERILKTQMPDSEQIPQATYIELDMGRLFQGLWLDQYEELMPPLWRQESGVCSMQAGHACEGHKEREINKLNKN